MPLTAGTRFGSYEILALLGAGGMRGDVSRDGQWFVVVVTNWFEELRTKVGIS
jgi:hypothetical protein